MKTIKNLVFLIFVILISDAQKIKMSGRRACMKVKETLGKQAQCEHGEEHLIFFQNSNIGNVVKFSKKDELKLKIECLNFRVGIDLDRIPQLNFESINKIELSGCSVSNSSLLSAIKSSFRIKKVKSLTITSTNEPNLVTVPDDLFKDFTELEELEMTSSFRVSYNKTVFKALTSLKTLKLHVNDIIALPSIIFEPLENVRNLVLSGSGSPKHEAKKFNIVLNKCINMQTFTLTGIRWPVQIGALVNFVGPLKVSILHNRFGSEISSRAFEKASYIEKLFLTNNSIKSLPKDVFAWQTSMTVIDVSFNLIVELHNDIFKAARSLEIINLSHNQITFITR